MATPTPTRTSGPAPFNPVPCGISPHAFPAVFVVEAYLPVSAHDVECRHYLVCSQPRCVEDVELHVSALALQWERRVATVAELEAVSGLHIGQVA